MKIIKKCADCWWNNISQLWKRKNDKWRIMDYYDYCKDCNSENIFKTIK